jgi:hypothetical protein
MEFSFFIIAIRFFFIQYALLGCYGFLFSSSSESSCESKTSEDGNDSCDDSVLSKRVIQKSTSSGCIAWKGVEGCHAASKKLSASDELNLGCQNRITRNMSGYCQVSRQTSLNMKQAIIIVYFSIIVCLGRSVSSRLRS